MIELISIIIFYSIRKFRNRPTERSRKENIAPVVVKQTKSNVIPFPKRIGK